MCHFSLCALKYILKKINWVFKIFQKLFQYSELCSKTYKTQTLYANISFKHKKPSLIIKKTKLEKKTRK